MTNPNITNPFRFTEWNDSIGEKMTLIKIIADALGNRTELSGKYVKSFDPDWNEGWGHLAVTNNVKEAMRFPSAAEALDFYTTPSKVKPVRPDGKPNRPMTAYTVELVHEKRT